MYDNARVIFHGILPVSEKLWPVCRGYNSGFAVRYTSERAVFIYLPFEQNLIKTVNQMQCVEQFLLKWGALSFKLSVLKETHIWTQFNV